MPSGKLSYRHRIHRVRTIKRKSGASLESEFEPEIDRHEVVFGPVHDVVGRFGEDPDVRCKAVFDAAAKVTRDAVIRMTMPEAELIKMIPKITEEAPYPGERIWRQMHIGPRSHVLTA